MDFKRLDQEIRERMNKFDLNGAIDIIDEHVKAKERPELLLNRKIEILMDFGRYDVAKAVIDRSNSDFLKINVLRLLQEQDSFKEQEDFIYSEIGKRFMLDSNLWALKYHQGEFQEALDILENADLEFHPSQEFIINAIKARCLVEIGKEKEGLALLEELNTKDQNDSKMSKFYLIKAQIFHKLGKHEKELKSIKQLLDLNDIPSYFTLSKIYTLAREIHGSKLAEKVLNIIKQMDPDYLPN